MFCLLEFEEEPSLSRPSRVWGPGHLHEGSEKCVLQHHKSHTCLLVSLNCGQHRTRRPGICNQGTTDQMRPHANALWEPCDTHPTQEPRTELRVKKNCSHRWVENESLPGFSPLCVCVNVLAHWQQAHAGVCQKRERERERARSFVLTQHLLPLALLWVLGYSGEPQCSPEGLSP